MNSIEPLLVALARDLQDVRVLWQVAVIALSLAIAALVSHRFASRLRPGADSKWELGFGGLRRLIFPLSALLCVLLGRWVISQYQNVNLLSIAVALLCAMAIIRVAIYILRRVFAPGGMLHAFERTIAWFVWVAFALHVVGLTPEIIDSLELAGFSIGKERVSLLVILQGALWILIALLLSLWLGRVIEERLMSAQGVNITLRVMLTKLTRALLLVLAVLIVLPALGVDLTALSVLGGAIGVGIGFGLQKIASNYISGFIILLDRSVTIGDLITVDKHTGQLVKMSARYIVVRGLDGTEAIIPNETVITSTVVNQSYTDRNVRVGLGVQVSYDCDLEGAMQLLREIAARHPRALSTPSPNVLIKSFGESGIDLELGLWVKDPEAGTANLQSDLYYDVWRDFRAKGIEIPYPRREVRLAPPVATPPQNRSPAADAVAT